MMSFFIFILLASLCDFVCNQIWRWPQRLKWKDLREGETWAKWPSCLILDLFPCPIWQGPIGWLVIIFKWKIDASKVVLCPECSLLVITILMNGSIWLTLVMLTVSHVHSYEWKHMDNFCCYPQMSKAFLHMRCFDFGIIWKMVYHFLLAFIASDEKFVIIQIIFPL